MTAPPRPDWLWDDEALLDSLERDDIDMVKEIIAYIEWLEQQLELCEAKLESYREPLPWGDLD